MKDSLVTQLLRAAAAAPSADNSQPWLFKPLSGSTVRVVYARERVQGMTFDRLAPASLLALGAVEENIRQTAQACDLSLNIQRWPQDPDGYFDLTGEVVLPAKEEAALVPDEVLGRHTNRFPYLKTPVTEQVIQEISALRQGDARTAVITGRAMRDVAALVRLASEVRFQTREVHEWLGKSLRFTSAEAVRGDGLDVATLALPPGGIALLRFLTPWSRMRALNRIGAFRLMAAIEAMPVKAGPALVGIISPSSPDQLLDAGMLMQRAWIALNAAGLAVHPYYVIPDQLNRLVEGKVPDALVPQVTGLDGRCQAMFALAPGEQLQMLFRVGYPTREAPRSRRLPLDELVETGD